ncbi:protein translocase subunit SecF [Intestinibacillus massiliensis]|uniref:protein translocase subunit SecF n=1 Tax=Intestinibacillus massiliensis TaxID=1871029 RepID=UPI000B34CFCC|nr:protein translocase subunit SecF [Intestinibacillus massiliensis]
MKSKFQIIKNFKIFGIISCILCIVGIVSLIALPFGKNFFNLSIDFAGGTEMEFNMHAAVTPDMKGEIADLFKEATGVDGTVVEAGSGVNQQAIIRSTSIDTDKRSAVIEAMKAKFNLTDDDLYNNEDVSASVGNDLKTAAFISAILAAILMMIYIAIRFEFTSGLAAVVCLLHDLFVMLSFYVIFQVQMDQNFIAAALTILGYSINASIIVFDRVRENLRVARKEPFEDVAERSVWQTMGRTINTTVTTLLTVGMVFILGVPSLRNFTLPLIIGIVSGAYSSIFLSASLWGKFRKIFRRRHA